MKLVLPFAVLAVAACAESPPPQAAPPPPPEQPVATASVTPPPEAPPAKRPRVKTTTFEVAGGALALPGPVVFETGSDRLSPVSDDVLEVAHDFLDAKPDITLLRIEGHTDSDGSADDNQRLSEKRALSVARWLVAAGVACSRLVPVGFGQMKPVAPDDGPENKARNRRIALVPAALRGRAIGGNPVDGGGKVAGDPCR